MISVTAGAALLAAILNGDKSIDEARIQSIVSLVMDGVRPPVGNGKPRLEGSTR